MTRANRRRRAASEFISTSGIRVTFVATRSNASAAKWPPGLSSMGGGVKGGTRCSGQKRDHRDPSPGAVWQCNGLRTRSLKPRPVTISNCPTIKPCATPASGANSTHPSPCARPFRLRFNGLAQSELRRIFCSDEGALMRVLRGRAQPCLPNLRHTTAFGGIVEHRAHFGSDMLRHLYPAALTELAEVSFQRHCLQSP